MEVFLEPVVEVLEPVVKLKDQTFLKFPQTSDPEPVLAVRPMLVEEAEVPPDELLPEEEGGGGPSCQVKRVWTANGILRTSIRARWLARGLNRGRPLILGEAVVAWSDVDGMLQLGLRYRVFAPSVGRRDIYTGVGAVGTLEVLAEAAPRMSCRGNFTVLAGALLA